MKKSSNHSLAGLGLLLPLLVACQAKELKGPEGNVPDIFHAETEGVSDPQAKAYMDADYHVFWNADDRISIFAKVTQNREFRFLGADGDNAGDFSSVTDPASATELSRYYAASPYRAGNGISDGGVISISLPAAQTYHVGTVDPAAQLMVAVSDTRSFSFRNPACVLGFQLKGSGVNVSSLTLSGNDSEVLAGTAQITPGDAPTMEFAPAGRSTSITLTAASPVALDPDTPTTFWLALPPLTFTGGFTLTVTDASGNTFVKSVTRSLTLSRNYVYRMAALEVVPVPAGAPAAEGIYQDYRSGGTPYLYDPATDQVNVYEAEGNVWVRYINPSTLRMYELGPIPAGVAQGDAVSATLTETLAGAEVSTKAYTLEALDLTGGILTLADASENYFVLRF